MTAPLFTLPIQTPVQSSGTPYAAAKLYFYGAGTLIAQTVYQDIGLTTPHANPVVADSSGRFAAIYLNPSASLNYRAQLKTSADVLVYDQDNIPKSFVDLTAPGPIGSVTPSTAAFTTLAASSTVSGAGFTAYFASPPSIGSTAAGTGKFTTLQATGLSTFVQAATPSSAVTFAATGGTLNTALSNVFTLTMTANVTSAYTLSNATDGQTINWFITQDGTGSRTMTWPSSFKWPAGSAGVLSTPASSVDLLVATYRSSTGFWYCSLTKAFA